MRTSGSITARSASWHGLHDVTLTFHTSFLFVLVGSDSIVSLTQIVSNAGTEPPQKLLASPWLRDKKLAPYEACKA